MANAVLKNLAVAFGGGLAFGVGMKLGQASAQQEAGAAVDLNPLTDRLDEIESQIRNVATAVLSNAPKNQRSDALESQAVDQIAEASETRLALRLEQADQRITRIEAKLELGDIPSAGRGSESAQMLEELEIELRAVIDASVQELETRLQRDVSNIRSETIQAVSQTIETTAVRRISALEQSLTGQSEAIEGLRQKLVANDQHMEKLLATVKQFFDQTTKLLARKQSSPDDASMNRTTVKYQAEESKWPQRKWQVVFVLSLLALIGTALFPRSFEPRLRRDDAVADRRSTESVAGSRATASQKTVAPPVQKAPKAESEPKASRNIRGNVRVDLVAQEVTWIEAVSGGKPAFVGLLEPGQEKTLESFENIRIVIGNAGGVQIKLDGKRVGPLGARGQVRILEFTPEGFHIVPRRSPQGHSAFLPLPELLLLVLSSIGSGTGWLRRLATHRTRRSASA